MWNIHSFIEICFLSIELIHLITYSICNCNVLMRVVSLSIDSVLSDMRKVFHLKHCTNNEVPSKVPCKVCGCACTPLCIELFLPSCTCSNHFCSSCDGTYASVRVVHMHGTEPFAVGPKIREGFDTMKSIDVWWSLSGFSMCRPAILNGGHGVPRGSLPQLKGPQTEKCERRLRDICSCCILVWQGAQKPEKSA